MIEVKKNIEDELRGALLEAKESIGGKRKLNNELKEDMKLKGRCFDT